MNNYTGTVNGIDAQATPRAEPRCQAFINRGGTDYIQVTTTYPNLISALELACSKDAEVEVTYDDSTPENILTRVRLKDR